MRHVSWSEYADDTKALLASYRTGWAFIDMPEFKTTIKQELEPQKLMYLRFHGRNREKWRKHETTGERYDYIYSEEELEPFAKKVREIAAAGEAKILIYFNNHVRGQAPANALMMAHQIGMPATATVSEEFVQAFPGIKEAVKKVQVFEETKRKQGALL